MYTEHAPPDNILQNIPGSLWSRQLGRREEGQCVAVHPTQLVAAPTLLCCAASQHIWWALQVSLSVSGGDCRGWKLGLQGSKRASHAHTKNDDMTTRSYRRWFARLLLRGGAGCKQVSS